MKKIRHVPELDVEYTFAFSSGKKVTFRFHGETPKGRLLFCNVETGYFDDMSPERFSYLYEKQLLNVKRIPKKEPPKMQEIPKHWIENNSPGDEEVMDELWQRIATLRTLSDDKVERIKGRIGRIPSLLADDLEKWVKNDNATSEESAKLMGELYSAMQCIKDCG